MEREVKEVREVNGVGMVGERDCVRTLNFPHGETKSHWSVLSSRPLADQLRIDQK